MLDLFSYGQPAEWRNRLIWRSLMSLRAPLFSLIPEETARVARAAFPNGHISMQMRDELGPIYPNDQFRALFPHDGQPAQSPAQLALITIMQFAEGLSDRQAADAVRDRAGLHDAALQRGAISRAAAHQSRNRGRPCHSRVCYVGSRGARGDSGSLCDSAKAD